MHISLIVVGHWNLVTCAHKYGINQVTVFQKKTIFAKIKKLETQRLKDTIQLIKKSQCRTFASKYGNILDLAMVEVPVDVVMALIQYYDPPLSCFTFRNFQLAPTIEEFEEIMRCPLGDKKPYMFLGHHPAVSKVVSVLAVEEHELI